MRVRKLPERFARSAILTLSGGRLQLFVGNEKPRVPAAQVNMG
jgi:hypothetical protein